MKTIFLPFPLNIILPRTFLYKISCFFLFLTMYSYVIENRHGIEEGTPLSMDGRKKISYRFVTRPKMYHISTLV